MIKDFNMVEIAEDRFMNLDRIISRTKKIAWAKCKDHFDLVDIQITGQLPWPNFGAQDMMRKTFLETDAM